MWNHATNDTITPLSLAPFLLPLNIFLLPQHFIISPPIYPSFIFLLFLKLNLSFAALPHHSPAPFSPSIALSLFYFYCFKLTSADWPATSITCYTQQEALTHRDNQCVRVHNNISFIFGVLWKLFMKTLNIASVRWYKLAYEQCIPLGCSVWNRGVLRIFTQWWVSK